MKSRCLNEVFESFSDAKDYAESSPMCYEGQLLVVKSRGVVRVYMIKNHKLVPLEVTD